MKTKQKAEQLKDDGGGLRFCFFTRFIFLILLFKNMLNKSAEDVSFRSDT